MVQLESVHVVRWLAIVTLLLLLESVKRGCQPKEENK